MCRESKLKTVLLIICSLTGMLLIFIGLYSVLWAKGKEDLPPGDDGLESDFDAEKPLLS